ncbi:hypothetical protein VRRI112168_00220 [Vreelandella rituensis]|uniref:hypothetical protein n=1 Tax=Vreelandella rituensis TaxID=2282306 RepID=UPI0015EFEF66|nr:hypothetical protein [Halomonas rituensis]
MGFFSWKTADTQESIPACSHNRRMVYLLQPGGEPPIGEGGYQGNGSFGGVDAHVWLAERNLAGHPGVNIDAMDEEQKREMGIELLLGGVMQDQETGDYWHIMSDLRPLVPGHYFAGTFGQTIPELGQTPAELEASGRFCEIPLGELMAIPFPLKFSFDPEAQYEALEGSKICPRQGEPLPPDDEISAWGDGSAPSYPVTGSPSKGPSM